MFHILIFIVEIRLIVGATAVLGEQNSTDDNGTNFIQTRVTDGIRVASTRAYPSFVYFPGISCGGALTSPNLVLTAAHCVNREGLDKLYVVAGTINNPQNSSRDSETWQQRLAIRSEVHPKYDKSNNYDIAIVEVCPFEMNQDVNVVTHFARRLNRVKRGSGVVVGYGVTTPISVTIKEYPTKRFPNSLKLRLALQQIISPKTCKKVYESYVSRNAKEQEQVRDDAQFIFPSQNTQICGTSVSGQSPCIGDSGGPLYCETTNDDGREALCGIVSFGSACGDDGVPTVYTGFYRNDIMQWIRGQQNRVSQQSNGCNSGYDS